MSSWVRRRAFCLLFYTGENPAGNWLQDVLPLFPYNEKLALLEIPEM